MLIKDNFKCVGFMKNGIRETELYDRTEPIPDLHNLSGEPEYSRILSEMSQKLGKWLEKFETIE